MTGEKCSIKVHIGGRDKVFRAEAGDNLQKVLLKNHSGFSAPCGGRGICGKCKVHVSGQGSAPTEAEKRKLTEGEFESGIRLACQVTILGDIEVQAPEQKSAFIQIEGLPYEVQISPLAQRVHIALPETSLTYCPDDMKRISESLKRENLKASAATLAKISNILDGGKQDVLATVTEHELIDIDAAENPAENNCNENSCGENNRDEYGFATDIGTTTIVGYLINLKTGAIEETVSELNEQADYGADVLSRISYGRENRNGNGLLHKKLVDQLGNMLKKAVERKGIAKESVSNMSFTGNTTMMHFLLGLNPFRISVAPFIPVVTSSVICRAGELGITYHPQCLAYLVPSVSAYVGADITAGMLVCSLLDQNKAQLLVDIGTNGEMALSRNGDILCCSVAAGPAFEGARIRCGVGGIEGAIDSITFHDGIFKVHTLSDKKPVGLCGSGLVDAISLMVTNYIIDEGGRFTEPDEWLPQAAGLSNRLQTVHDEKVFMITNDVYLCQQDIREVQLAKAAVHAGITTLLKNQEVDCQKIDTVWLAGGFGNKLNKESAVNIGLLPGELASKIRPAGNTSGIGAVMALLSKDCREECNIIKSRARYLELSGLPGFNDTFIDAIGFDA